jgi:NAD(P)-dependent dehydrogenase (short-subunit alcohol dehydrogenase family)
MSKWTLADVPDQTGRVAIVTGASSGLGLETARALVQKGATVIVAVRDVAKGEAAAASMTGPGRAVVSALDLASLASIEEFAKRFAEEHASLDLLIDNAGVMALPRSTTVDGFETQLGTNHLGHFALTARLFPLLAKATAARVVVVSSSVHWGGTIRFDDLMGERSYDKWMAYMQSKLANLLFTFELSRRLVEAKSPVMVAAAHPGYAGTNLQLRGPEARGARLEQRVWPMFNALFAQTAAMGALPTLYAATSPDVRAGEYFGPRGPFGLWGYPTRAWRSSAAKDAAAARRLWEESERLVGLKLAV